MGTPPHTPGMAAGLAGSLLPARLVELGGGGGGGAAAAAAAATPTSYVDDDEFGTIAIGGENCRETRRKSSFGPGCGDGLHALTPGGRSRVGGGGGGGGGGGRGGVCGVCARMLPLLAKVLALLAVAAVLMWAVLVNLEHPPTAKSAE